MMAAKGYTFTGWDQQVQSAMGTEDLTYTARWSKNKDTAYLNTICDSVYSICLFMGRPAYNKKGKDILKSLMGIGYSSKTRNYARDTLKKIIALEL